ncbi:hypothetical protein CEE45_12600 [Candidatus Heimdallarchaeota archaeon B3_Heim]|nr:MAG: hypothetical protein CEE45_12600 [Candidatus Heimdallarchaeota archaeon B3_Heim]
MKLLSKLVEPQSIRDYLNLDLHSWLVEFDVSDFGASLSTLFELPLPVYLSQAKGFFWNFLSHFFTDCSISFILRTDQDTVDLAFLGRWKNQKLAIPLWIMDDTLIGFEILSAANYSMIDSYLLTFESPFTKISQDTKNTEVSILDNDLYHGNMLYLKIMNNSIILSDYQQIDELAFFERITSVVIPEIDENIHDDEASDN